MGREIHIVLDNPSAHKTKAVEFLEHNPRVRFHFTPTYSSWLNQVELWFAKIQRDVIDRGVFNSVADLARKLRRYICAYEKSARPFRWTYANPQRRIRHLPPSCRQFLRSGFCPSRFICSASFSTSRAHLLFQHDWLIRRLPFLILAAAFPIVSQLRLPILLWIFENGAAALQSQERPDRQVEEKQKRIEFLEKRCRPRTKSWPS
jgi:DDE superfamily endonuclease